MRAGLAASARFVVHLCGVLPARSVAERDAAGADRLRVSRRPGGSLVVLDDLEPEQIHAHSPALVVGVPARGPCGDPLLIVFARIPSGHDEVSVLADHGAQQFESQESLE